MGFSQKANFKIFDQTGGVNTKLHPIVVPDNACTELANLDHTTPGLIKGRLGYDQIADTPISGSTGRIRGIWHFAPDGATEYLLAASSVNPQTLYKWDGVAATWTSIGNLTGFSAAAELNGVQANNKFYLFDGAHAPVSLNSAANAISSTSGFPLGKVATWWLGRLWIASGTDSNLYFSNALDPDTFDTTNQLLKVGYGNGQKIVGIAAIRNDELIVYMEESIYRLQPAGDVFGLSVFGFPASSQFSITPISTTIGCGAQRSIALAQNDMIFLDQFGRVRSLRRTELDAQAGVESLPLSDAVDGTLPGAAAKTASVLSKAAAIMKGREYRIAYSSQGSSDVDQLLIFDTVLRSWNGPHSLPFQRMCVSDINGTQNLYGSKPANDFKVFLLDTGTNDDGTAIEFSWTTKRFACGDFDLQKVGWLLIVNAVATTDSTLAVKASVNGGGFTAIGTVELQGDAGTLPQTLPFALGGGGVVREKIQLESLERWNDLQFQFTCSDLDANIQILGFSLYVNIDPVVRQED